MQRLAARDWADVDLEAVLADAADEALAEVRARSPDMRSRALPPQPRPRPERALDVERRGSRLGHEHVAVEQSDAVAVALDRERPLEGRGQAKGDLDLVGVDERREPAARVAAVRRRERATKAARERICTRETTS